MNNKFDELAKGIARSVTRRQALKKFGVGLAGIALACFGLANRAEAKHCLHKGSLCDYFTGGGVIPPCCPGLTCTLTSNGQSYCQ